MTWGWCVFVRAWLRGGARHWGSFYVPLKHILVAFTLITFLLRIFISFSWVLLHFLSGMKYRSFQGHPNIVELECSGSVLDSNTDLLSITLYHSETNKVFASMNYAEGKCLTSSSFTLCELDKTASRNARIRTLITDLHYNERRSYSCDITTFKPGERANFVSWSLEVSFASKPLLFRILRPLWL